MTLRQALLWGQHFLSCSSNTQTPQLDARILLNCCAKITLQRLIVDSELPISLEIFKAYRQFLKKRAAGYPVAWLVGTKEFMGLDFFIKEGILVPRPDTETLVEVALGMFKQKKSIRVLDVCCGSGCIGISLAVCLGSKDGQGFSACDISDQAVATTKLNAYHHGLGAYQVFNSDLLAHFSNTSWDLIISNPPYLTSKEAQKLIEQENWKEPALALDGGAEDGLDIIRRLIHQASYALNSGGHLILEASPPQGPRIFELLSQTRFCNIQVHQDLSGQERAWIAQKR